MSLEGNALYIGTFGGSPSDVFILKVIWMDIGIIVYDIETEFQNLQRPFLKHLDQVPV